MKSLITLAFLVLVTLPAAAQVAVQPVPAAPIAGHPFLIRFTSSALTGTRAVTQTGNHFRFEFDPCLITCPEATIDVPMSPLPEGTYTYEVIVGSAPMGSGSFSVGVAPYDVIGVQVVPTSPRVGHDVMLRFFNANLLDECRKSSPSTPKGA